MSSRLGWLLVTLILSGCTDPLTKFINGKFPPINIEQQRQTAIETTAEALSALPTPNIAVSIRTLDLEKAANSDDLRKQGVTALKVSSEKQLIHIRAEFKRIFTEADGGESPDVRKALATLKPEISGTIDAYSGLSGTIVTHLATEPELQIKLLPGLSHIEIDKVTVAGNVDATKIGEVLATVLNKYRDNITGELTRAPFSRVSIPAISDKQLDLSQSLKLAGPNQAFAVTIKANKVIVPLMLKGIAWLIDENQVVAVLQLSQQGAPTSDRINIEKTFEAIDGQITGFIDSRFGVSNSPGSTWVAVRKDLLAATLTNAMSQAAACMSVAGNTQQKTSSKIPMPDGSGINCSSDRNCQSDRTCSFSANHDTRDCSACIVSAPRVCVPRSIFGPGGCSGGQCIQQGNDLWCEAQKAAQNAIYVADANLRKADCDRLRETETATCKAEELGKKVLCETGKATLNALRKTGNFANVDVDSDIRSDNLNICLRDFTVSPNLDGLTLNLDATGNATADVNVKFVPLDIVGHLTCTFPWKEKQRFKADIRDSTIPVKSSVKISTAQDKAKINFAIDEMTIKAKLSPGPTEYLLKSPMMTFACPGLNLAKPLVVTLTPFLPVLRGDIDHKVDKQEASMEVSLPILKVGSLDMKLAARETSKALMLIGN